MHYSQLPLTTHWLPSGPVGSVQLPTQLPPWHSALHARGWLSWQRKCLLSQRCQQSRVTAAQQDLNILTLRAACRQHQSPHWDTGGQTCSARMRITRAAPGSGPAWSVKPPSNRRATLRSPSTRGTPRLKVTPLGDEEVLPA